MIQVVVVDWLTCNKNVRSGYKDSIAGVNSEL